MNIFPIFMWFFLDFFLHFTTSLYSFVLDFCEYFAFFSAGKKAINTTLVDLESSERGLQLWFFYFLDYFLL